VFGVGEFADEFLRLSQLLEEAHRQLSLQVALYAETEATYRRAKAEAWVLCPFDDRKEWTAARREAWVNAETSVERRNRDLAEGLRRASLEAIRSYRGQISALQTLVNSQIEEAKFAQTRPDY
jgi:hypothetical protein